MLKMAGQDTTRRRWGGHGLLVLTLILTAGCRAPFEGDPPDARQGLLELLGIEVDNLERKARDLRRDGDRGRREVARLTVAREAVLEERAQALARQRDAQAALARELARLKFLEESLVTAVGRRKEVLRRLAQLDAAKKRVAGAEKELKGYPNPQKRLASRRASLKNLAVQLERLRKRQVALEVEIATANTAFVRVRKLLEVAAPKKPAPKGTKPLPTKAGNPKK